MYRSYPRLFIRLYFIGKSGGSWEKVLAFPLSSLNFKGLSFCFEGLSYVYMFLIFWCWWPFRLILINILGHILSFDEVWSLQNIIPKFSMPLASFPTLRQWSHTLSRYIHNFAFKFFYLKATLFQLLGTYILWKGRRLEVEWKMGTVPFYFVLKYFVLFRIV